MEAPDPTNPRHQHLHGEHDVRRARVELDRMFNAQPLMAACVLCGHRADLTATLRRHAPNGRSTAQAAGVGGANALARRVS
ncbi:hypothetical protein [Kineococcus esterisolvens]|uniref:hypothetical protein n=1 Tax=unclassified Kineococcus TaxID=2621656 RepID=UPI003D7C43D6